MALRPTGPGAASDAEPEPTHFGSGWISGVLATALGAVGLGAVICFHFPSLFTMPELRELYPLPLIRGLLHLVLIAAFVLGATSILLRRNKTFGAAGILLTLAATLIGGSRVPVEGSVQKGPFLGLDWFLLNVIAYSAVFVPIERLFPRLSDQPIFRSAWRTDLAYFFASSLLVQLTTLLTLKPAALLFSWASSPGLRAAVAAQPFALQFAAILLATDLTQYWIHRLFHQSRWLWRFHRIHHSAESMDWLAGSRLHLVDVVVTRGLTYVPIYVLGFADGPTIAYVAFVSIQATFIHANVRFRFGPLRFLLATPQFHHWHHAADAEGVDKNFAVHLPVLDRIFGTFYLPGSRWPAAYGLAGGDRVEPGYWRQLVEPFRPAGRARVAGSAP
jgi:lathosterol oxidase